MLVMLALSVHGDDVRVPRFEDAADPAAAPFRSDDAEFAGLVVGTKDGCHDDWRLTELAAVSDLDGEGAPELFLTSRSGPHCGCEGDGSVDSALFTLRGGKLRPYASAPERSYPAMSPEAARRYELVRDLDGDGRPDLVGLIGPYSGIEIPEVGNLRADPAVPGVFVLHARADGTFSADDAVAAAPVRAWCAAVKAPAPAPGKRGAARRLDPTSLANLASDDAGAFAQAVVCARLRGHGAAEVHAAATAACRESWKRQEREAGSDAARRAEALERSSVYDGDKRDCMGWIKDLIDREPPLRLK